jgi:hypothetical protein
MQLFINYLWCRAIDMSCRHLMLDGGGGHSLYLAVDQILRVTDTLGNVLQRQHFETS